MYSKILTVCLALFMTSCSVATFPIPELNTKGDVYKTEGENDHLIYTSTVGKKKVIMVYVDFPDAEAKDSTKERMNKVLGEGKFEEIFRVQSYGKVSFDFQHVHDWHRLPKSHKEYSSKTTESHRDLFVEVFKLYPEINFLDYEYIMVNVTRIGNTAFGEREDIAIPYKGKKIKVALNIVTQNPYVLVHETAHLMGLPDIYTYGGVKGPKNPAGPWDIMSIAYKASGFLGWHRHKLKWLDDDRKTYLSKGSHILDLSQLNSDSGISMVAVPSDSPLKPSKVFVVELAQAVKERGGEYSKPKGVLVYSVDAKIASGQNPLIVYPKEDLQKAQFFPGDTFDHKDSPMKVEVLKRNEDSSYTVKVDIK